MFKKLLFTATIFSLLPVTCTQVVASDGFYHQKQKGWFWHEPIVEPIEVEELNAQSEEQPVNTQPVDENKMVTIDSKWLRENLPRLQENAINDPSEENLGAFYAAQRVMIDMSSQFSTKSREFFQSEAPWLSENHRRPTDSFMLTRFKQDLLKAQKPVIDKVSQQAGIWFFFSSQCAYCEKQLPLVQLLEKQYNISVLYVSLDGGIMSGMPEKQVVYDHSGKVAADFNVNVTPTTFLVSNDASKFHLLSNGVSALPHLQDALVSAAHKYNWISDSEFKSVQSVRGSNVTDDGLLQIKESELSNPSVIYEALRNKVDLSDSPIGTPFTIGVKQ